MLTYFLFIIGFIVLIKGARLLIDGASAIAKRWGISDLVIGLTIIAFGTSTPELFVNVIASFRGTSEIVLGTVVGSSIARILLALGAASLLAPLVLKKGTVIREIPFSLAALGLVFYLANDVFFHAGTYNTLTRVDGLILIGLFIVFIISTFILGRVRGRERITVKTYSLFSSCTMIFLGSIGLAFGGKWIVEGAISIAQVLGVSEAMIGLTIIAIGTTLPELIVSVIAAVKKNADIALGNIIGANIFNLLLVLGLSTTIRPLHFPIRINLDILIFALATVLLIIFLIYEKKGIFSFLRGTVYRLARWEGAIFIIIYILYIVSVIMRR